MRKGWPKTFQLFPRLVMGMLFVDFYLIFLYAPLEKIQGAVQKIFYFHVSSAFAMYAGFLLAALFALLYLWKRKEEWDDLSHSSTSVGLLFCTMVLVSGPVWAKPVWGAWWSWDPRLTTTLLLWLIFFSTLLLRRFFGADRQGRVAASLLTLFGVLDIPLIFLSVKLWRGIHPSVLGGEANMPFEMKGTLIFSNITVLLLFLMIFWMRARLRRLESAVNRFYLYGEERK